jgi:hypothetical protein
LDPFWGTGTTSLAAMISARNSIGYEINSDFMKVFKVKIPKIKQLNININNNRLNKHIDFIKKYRKEIKETKYKSVQYNFPVITKQEIDILLYSIKSYSENKNEFMLTYEKFEFDNNI